METFRYIITRACLQEGSLRLQRFLRPHFPAEGETVKLFDESGHNYEATVTGERLLGVGPFYRDHNLSVNDVVMITPLLPGCYKVEGIVKPYARPEPERSRGEQRPELHTQAAGTPSFTRSRPEAATEVESGVRVVVNATPHVREVRTQRPGAPVSSPWASMERETAQRAERASRYRVPALGTSAEETAVEAAPKSDAELRVSVKPVRAVQAAAQGPAALAPRVETELAQARAEASRMAPRPQPSEVADRTPLNLLEESTRAATPAVKVVPRSPAAAEAVTEVPQVRGAGSSLPTRLRSGSAGSAAAASQRLLRDLASAPDGVRRASRDEKVGGDSGSPNESLASSGWSDQSAGGSVSSELSRQQSPGQAEELLESVGRRCGYRVDYPAADLIRLRAELGQYSHSVLVATGGRAINSAEWRETGGRLPTYRLWLTPEAQVTVDAPVMTPEALQQLSMQVQDAPFTPLDLRPFWEAGRFNQAAAQALAAQRATERQQDAAFQAVLRALAQQPAPSLVTSARLAQQLEESAGGAALAPARLAQILTMLTRSPYRLLSALGEGHYLLEQDVPQYLLRLGQQFQGLSDEMGQPRLKVVSTPQADERTWSAEEILRG